MKFHEEYYIENAYFMKQAYKYCYVFNTKELNQLELAFLQAIDYNLMVSEDEIDKYFFLVTDRAQVLQCKKFKIHTDKFEIIEDYFKKPDPLTNFKTSHSKIPLVFLNGKLFKGKEEVYHFFDCEEICEDKTAFSESSSIYTLSEDSPKM